MRNGICSKCGHNDVRVGQESSTGLGRPSTFLGIQAFVPDTQANYDVYVCMHCGYVELGLSDTVAMQKIAEQWPRINPPPSPQQPG